MTAMTTRPDGYDDRVRELSKMPKARLAALIRVAHPRMWTASPLETWNKDELVNNVLDDEFSEFRSSGAI